jgi:hypothetical protein
MAKQDLRRCLKKPFVSFFRDRKAFVSFFRDRKGCTAARAVIL